MGLLINLQFCIVWVYVSNHHVGSQIREFDVDKKIVNVDKTSALH